MNGVPDSFKSIVWSGKSLPDYGMTIQVAPDDCTGCGVCVDVWIVVGDGWAYDIDIERMDIDPQMELSRRTESRLPMRWIAILDPQVDASLAANSGIHTAADIFKMLLVGADVTMLAAALIRHGPEHITKLLNDLRGLLTERDYQSVRQLRGSFNYRNTPNPAAFERHNYMKALTSFISGLG